MKSIKMNRGQQGFTLIELMIVIAIVGILAAIALPAYQDYTIRARMSELLATAAEAKTTIAEFVAAQGSVPPDAEAAGIQTVFSGGLIASAAYSTANGGQQAVYAITASNSTQLGAAAAMVVNMTGTIDVASRRVQWVCGPADTANSKYLPASCRGN